MAANTYWRRRETRSMRLLFFDWAVIDRPYSFGFATVGALYERPRCISCAKRITAISTLLLFCWCLSASAQGTTDISGMWIVQDPGSGNWSDWYNNVPKPSLRPEIIKE